MLDHITIRTTKIEENRDFFVSLLGLEVGKRPVGFDFPGYWLYDGERPIVHLVGTDADVNHHGGEAYDHVAFRLEGYEQVIERIEAMGIARREYKIPDMGEHRIYVDTPSGLPVELCIAGYEPEENA